MKNRVMMISIISTMLLLICGCGKSDNKMVCSAVEADGVLKYNYVLNYDSDWEEIETFEIEEIIDFSKVEDFSSLGCGESLDECMVSAKNDYEVCKNNSIFSNCKIENETKDGLKIVAVADDKELKKEDNVFSVTKTTSKDSAKVILEKEGYECK